MKKMHNILVFLEPWNVELFSNARDASLFHCSMRWVLSAAVAEGEAGDVEEAVVGAVEQ